MPIGVLEKVSGVRDILDMSFGDFLIPGGQK
jgi:hypothetical protein